MKNKLNEALFKGSCVLLATTLVGSFCIKGKGAFKKTEIEPQEIVSSNMESTEVINDLLPSKEISVSTKNENPHLKIGAYVTVHGRGNEASDGSGKLGYSWDGKEMMIVGIRENSEYPYACAIVDSTPGVEDVMAWFKMDVIEPLTEKTVDVTERTKVIDKDGYVTYLVPDGYTYFSDTDLCINTTIRYVCSDESKEEIAKQYSITLK